MSDIQLNQVCYRTLDAEVPHALDTYLALGGYQSLQKILKESIPREEVLKTIKDSGLRGRGGAGFPTGMKWSFINTDDPKKQRYLVCNSDESEPGTCKDTLIMLHNPHQLIEGIAIAAYVMGVSVAYNYMRGEFKEQYQRCCQAVREAEAKGFLGDNILGSDFSLKIHQVIGSGAYIAGEETAMLEAIEGKPARPRNKPPFPAMEGLYGCPTTINNTESLASVPVIMEKGSQWFKDLGVEGSGGTKIFCVSGHIQKPGVHEVPLGTPFKDLLAHCGGLFPGRKLKAVIPGGTSMKVIPGDKMQDLTLDYQCIGEAGSAIGSGGMIIMDDTTCMVSALKNMIHFYRDESCGQCTPCREGTTWIDKMLSNLLAGEGTVSDLKRIYSVAKNIEGRTICAFGEAVSWPVTSFLDHFYDEFEYYVTHGHSMLSTSKENS